MEGRDRARSKTTPPGDGSFRRSITLAFLFLLTGRDLGLMPAALAQSCAPYWSCTVWSVCSNATQTRSCTDLNLCGATRTPPAQQACETGPEIITDVMPTGGDLSGNPAAAPGQAAGCLPGWYCSGWSVCQNGSQSRTCTDVNTCNTTAGRPSLTQSCGGLPACTADWNCTAWSACSNGVQTRSCSDRNNCGSNAEPPDALQSCTPSPAQPTPTPTPATQPATCSPGWTCTAWSACSSGGQSRICSDSNSCGSPVGKPVESQSCTETSSVVLPSAPLDSTPPSSPTGLAATALAPTQVNVKWNTALDNIGVTGYQLYRHGARVATTAMAAYADTGLTALTWYAYTVAATDAAGNHSARSAVLNVLTPPPADRSAPTISHVVVSTVTGNTATITWQTSEPATSQVEYGLTTSYGLQTAWSATPVISQAVPISGLAPGNTYHYRAVSKDSSGNTALTQDVLLHTAAAPVPDRTPPLAVTDLTLADVQQTSLVLTWTAPLDASGVVNYDIRYGTVPLTPQNFLSASMVQTTLVPAALGTRQSQYVSVGLIPGLTYFFALTATDAAGNTSTISNVPQATMRAAPTTSSQTPSPQPGTLSVPIHSAGAVVGYTVYQLADATPPAAPTEVAAQGTDGQVILRWHNPQDPDFVRVQILRSVRVVAADQAHGVIIYEGSDVTFTDRTAQNGITYTYGVSAYDRSGNFAVPVSLQVAPRAGVTQVNAPVVTGVTVGARTNRAWLVIGAQRQEVFVIFPDGTRRQISSRALAKRLGVLVERAAIVDDRMLAAYPLGTPLTAADLNLLEILDSDGDTLPDAWEQRLGIDSQRMDTDGDGFDDGVELAGGFDPRFPPPTASATSQLIARVRGRFVVAEQRPFPLYYVAATRLERIPLPDESAVWTAAAVFGLPLAAGRLTALPDLAADGYLLVDGSDGRVYYRRAGKNILLRPGHVLAQLRPHALSLPPDDVALLPYRWLRD